MILTFSRLRMNVLRQALNILLIILALTSPAHAASWCIQPGVAGSGCLIERSDDQVLNFVLTGGYSIRVANTSLGDQSIKIFHQNQEIQEIFSGAAHYPKDSIKLPLSDPFDLFGVITIRPDGILEIGRQGSPHTYYVPLNGGVMLVPNGVHYTVLWLGGGNDPRTLREMSSTVRTRIQWLTNYLGLPPLAASTPSNYYFDESIEESSLSFLGTSTSSPACCCGGTGKRTLILGVGGKGSEDGSGLLEAFDGLSLKEKECAVFERFRYKPDTCLDKNAQDLEKRYNTRNQSGAYCKVVVLAHSQGGIVAATAAGDLPGSETHTLASPLQGTGFFGFFTWGQAWNVGYVVPPAGALVADAFTNCMTKEDANTHDYKPLPPGASLVTHTQEPVWWLTLESQRGGPLGSTTVAHPGTDHDSIVPAGVKSVAARESCSDCGDGVVEGPAEECDPPGDACTATTPWGTTRPGECTKECSCQPTQCGNGRLEVGEQCERDSDCPVNPANPSIPMKCDKLCNCYDPGPPPQPRCGDGRRDPGEQCDPPGSQCIGQTPSGSGTCSAQCECIDNCTGESGCEPHDGG